MQNSFVRFCIFSFLHQSLHGLPFSRCARVCDGSAQGESLTSPNKRLISNDIEAPQKSAFNTACAPLIEQALADRLRIFHPLVSHPSVSGGISVQNIARAVQAEEEMYIDASEAFVEQRLRDAALAAQAEAAARTLSLQEVHFVCPSPLSFFLEREGFHTYAGSRYLRDFNVAHASEPTKVTKNKGKPGAAAAHSVAEGSYPQPA